MTMISEKFESIWDALCDDRAEALELKRRSTLLYALEREVRRQNWSPGDVARSLEVDVGTVDALITGAISNFTSDRLAVFVGRLGLLPEA
jgi:predicted XRE-type DNA-binding protein